MEMSELQIGLIGVGVAAVAAVFGYNKWLEYRQTKSVRKSLGDKASDLFASGGRHGSGDDSGPPGSRERREPGLQDSEAMGSPPAVSLPDLDQADARLDCIVRIDTAEPVVAGDFLQAQRTAIGDTDKPLRWMGFNEAAGEWDSLTAHSARNYRAWCGCMQLVDRRGPLGATAVRQLREGVTRLADQYLAVTDMEDDAALVQRAVELDRTCADLDIQVGLNVVAQQAQGFNENPLLRTLQDLGGVQGDDGYCHFPDVTGASRFVAVRSSGEGADSGPDGAPTKVLTLLLDVPRVEDGPAVFDDMARVARRLAANLQGALVDDNGQPVVDEALRMIREQIRQHHERMLASGIAPGSSTAIRLFG